MLAFIDALREVNPRARIILTVSPVPLAATACAGQHVLAATTYSKSVLRAACGEIQEQRPLVAYMPSYEIITGSYARGRYFADDLRSVTEAGVSHVMRVFLQHFAGQAAPLPAAAPAPALADTHAGAMQQLVDTTCEEAALIDAAGHAAAACGVCGGRRFGPGPGGRMASNGQAPCCLQCGALERHRSFAHVVKSLPAHYLRGAHALQAGTEACIAADWFGALTKARLADLAGTGLQPGAFGFIGMVYGLEFILDDRAAFDALCGLLAPDGILAICFVTPAARPSTQTGLNGAGLPDQAYQLYGGDLATHFGCAGKGLEVTAFGGSDPATGLTLAIHLFYRRGSAARALVEARGAG
jgi:hypothetical protein